MQTIRDCARAGAVLALVSACGLAAPARAGTWPEYTIQRIGLYGAEQTGSGGVQRSFAQFFNAPGFVAGVSTRYSGPNINGRDAWAWNGTTTTQIGLTGGVYRGSEGYQVSFPQHQNAAGHVAGYSNRIRFNEGDNGQDAWVWNGTTTTQIGLAGGVYTGSEGYQESLMRFHNAAGQVAGYSYRYTGERTNHGQDAWVWNGTTTTQVGFNGAGYVSSSGIQSSTLVAQNATGQLAGHSLRYTGAGTYNGQDSWVWNGTTTAQIGLTGGVYTGSAGYQNSEPVWQNDAGQVTGYSNRFTGVNTNNGQDSWAWNGTSTTQIGLTGGVYRGSAGYQRSELVLHNDAGQVAGYSSRFIGASTNNGQDAWAWNGTTTTQLGLTGGVYTGSAGYQASAPLVQGAAGHVAGVSLRFTGVDTGNGRDAWAWNGTTTTQIGLTGAGNIGSAGYRESFPQYVNAAGQVAGFSNRFTGVNTNNGQDFWVWNGTSTTQIGLTGGVYTGSAGRQYSVLQYQNAAGQLAGYSSRYTGVGTDNGRDAWVWNGTTTTQIGLTGGVYTGSAGRQYSVVQYQNAVGQLAGYSIRYTGVSTDNGRDAWVWNGTTTTQIGLTGGIYTGSVGRQYSVLQYQNAAGQLAGYSIRYSGVSTDNGRDAWYFDPITLLSSPIIGSVRASDNYAFSVPTILTEGGFLLGYYSFFDGGVSPAIDRAFIFRPDLGFTDLGDLVTGGLTPNGWSTLLRPEFADAMSTIVGHGYVNGQTTGQSVFVMTIPAPGAASLLGICGLVALRRQRVRG